MEVEGNSVISGAQLNDVIINNAVLCGDIKGGGLDIPIDKITAALQQISDDFQEGDNQLYNKITANSLCIASLDRKINDSTDAYNDVLSETSSLIIKTIS